MPRRRSISSYRRSPYRRSISSYRRSPYRRSISSYRRSPFRRSPFRRSPFRRSPFRRSRSPFRRSISSYRSPYRKIKGGIDSADAATAGPSDAAAAGPSAAAAGPSAAAAGPSVAAVAGPSVAASVAPDVRTYHMENHDQEVFMGHMGRNFWSLLGNGPINTFQQTRGGRTMSWLICPLILLGLGVDPSNIVDNIHKIRPMATDMSDYCRINGISLGGKDANKRFISDITKNPFYPALMAEFRQSPLFTEFQKYLDEGHVEAFLLPDGLEQLVKSGIITYEQALGML